MTQNAKKAFNIGAMCFIAYLAVYLARNILSTVTPVMQAQGFAKDAIGVASSIYFYTYAIGQLINGAIGDKIKAKLMMTLGLGLAGISNFLFALFNQVSSTYGEIPISAYIAYGATGFFLSMIYGPMTKIVAENMDILYATRCSLGYTFASYFGSPLAGLLATYLAWQSVFSIGSITLVVMSVIVFVSFTVFERKGMIVYGRFKKEKQSASKGTIRVLFERQIVKFCIISILTGVIRTSVIFWLPTYFSEHLSMSSERATMTFTVVSLLISCGSFIVIFVYEKLFHHNMDNTILVMFLFATIGLVVTYFVSATYINVAAIVLSIMASNGVATMLWSHYCPSLRDTGIVSGVTGFLDFLSYMAAATANIVFPYLIEKQEWAWNRIVLIWISLMIIGVAISIKRNKTSK